MSDVPPVAGSVSTAETADRELLASPTRQAPLAVVFLVFKVIRNLGVFQIGAGIALIASGRVPLSVLGLAPVVAAAILAVMLASWWRFVFSIRGDNLVVAKGIVAQERLSIPLARIQSVSIEQKFFHRLVGLVSIKVDTAGSDEAELELAAIDRKRADALQRLAAGRRSRDTEADGGPRPVAVEEGVPGRYVALPPSDSDEVLAQRDLRQLVRIGLSRWPWAGLVVLAPLVALAGEATGELFDVGPIRRLIERVVFDGVASIMQSTEESSNFWWLALAAIGTVIGLVMLAALLGAILQLVQTVVSEWDLRLVRTSTGLRRTAGLLSKTSRASSITRVQGIRTEQNPIERRMGFKRLSLPTIGDGDIVIPGTDDSEEQRIRSEVMGELEPPPLNRMISPAWMYLTIRNMTIFVVAVGLAQALLSPWFLGIYLTIPISALMIRRQWRLRRWGLSPDSIAEHLQFINSSRAEVPLFKAQRVEVSQSFFQRRRNLASVRVDAAEGHLEVPMIPLADAEYIRDLALFQAESSRRAWM